MSCFWMFSIFERMDHLLRILSGPAFRTVFIFCTHLSDLSESVSDQTPVHFKKAGPQTA